MKFNIKKYETELIIKYSLRRLLFQKQFFIEQNLYIISEK